MKSVLSAILAVVVALSASCCSGKDNDSGSSTEPDASTSQTTEVTAEPVTEEPASKGGFTVSGTKLLDANGNEFVMRGINHPHSWFTSEDDTALEAIAATGANTVRIVCGSGQQYTRDTVESLNKLTDKCRELEMVAILEVTILPERTTHRSSKPRRNTGSRSKKPSSDGKTTSF